MPRGNSPWRRSRTLEAAWALLRWRLAVALVPMRLWMGRAGTQTAPAESSARQGDIDSARALARHVERAAQRLPFGTLCLPRALALGSMLRRRGIGHTIVIAVRPPDLRGGDDSLHAWATVENTPVIGELPGPWNRILVLHTASRAG